MSIVHHFKKEGGAYRWEGVEGAALKMEGIEGAVKNILIGDREGAPNFIMRYFELQPGGHSKLEQHPHEHEVIILRGEGEVQLGDESTPVKPFDTVFVEGNGLHQFRNTGDEPFGFICIIPRSAAS
jgi:quercetin dioxygenase-like cupin family protein